MPIFLAAWTASALAGLWATGVHRVDLLLAFVVLFNLGGGLHIVAWQTAIPSNLGAGFVCFLVIGLGQTVLSVSQNTAVLVQAESGFRGRVVSIYLMAIIAGLPVGSAVLGTMARRYELSTVILLAAGSLLAHGLRATWKSGRFRAFDASRPPERQLSVATI